MSFQKILLPSDLSAEGERAFAPAAELAQRLGARLELLHVVESVGCAPVGGASGAPYLPGTEPELARAKKLLGEHARSFSGATLDFHVLVAPSVPHAIADYARTNGFDLIALSSHGRSGFRRLVLGSVAETLLRSSHVPVLVFPRVEERGKASQQ